MNFSAHTDLLSVGKCPVRKRRRYQCNGHAQELPIQSVSERKESYIVNNIHDTIQQVKEELVSWENQKNQSMCVELTSFLFDIFCQRVILSKLSSSSNKLDWFMNVRDLLHRSYMKDTLSKDEQQLVEKIEQEAISQYFTDDQWRCLLNLNVSMGQLCGHKKMDPYKLSTQVSDLAAKSLEETAQKIVQTLVEAMKKSQTSKNDQ